MRALELLPGNPMTRMLPVVLLSEVVVFGLAFPGMIYVSDRSVAAASVACGVAALLAILASAFLRRGSLGWALAWLTQVVAIVLGFLTPMMFVAGGLFAAIWVMSFVLGRRIDQTPHPQG